MNTDDGQRMNMPNNATRKPMAGKYPEKSPNYSPSSSYNYGQQSGYGAQTGYNGNSQMYQRRRPDRPDRFKREAPPPSDKLFRQNDIIIRLLKEIRDRLPEPRNAPIAESDATETGVCAAAPAESWERDENRPEACAEKNEDPMNDETGNDEPSGPGNQAPTES